MSTKELRANYDLEIYLPGTTDTVIARYTSSHPFAAINKGDILSYASFNLCGDVNPGSLKVSNIEHIIWEIKDSHITHKVCVFTEPFKGF